MTTMPRLVVSSAQLTQALQFARVARETKGSRPVLQHVVLQWHGVTLDVVASDGFIASHTTMVVGERIKPTIRAEALLDKHDVKALEKASGNHGHSKILFRTTEEIKKNGFRDTINIEFEDSFIRFASASFGWVDWKRVFSSATPEKRVRSLSIPVDSLLKEIPECDVLELHLEQDGVLQLGFRVHHKDRTYDMVAKSGQPRMHAPVEFERDANTTAIVSVDPKKLRRLLEPHAKSRVTLHCCGADAPLLITRDIDLGEGFVWQGLLMPMTVR